MDATIFNFEVNNDMCGAELNAGFVFEKADNSRTVKFTSTSTGSIEKYEWDFGDGNTYTHSETPFYGVYHYFPGKGTYNVTLQLYNSAGKLIDSYTKPVTVE